MGRHPFADQLLEAISKWRPEILSTFKVRAPGDQFSVRIDSEENPDGNYLEIFFDRELGPMMIFSRWHLIAREIAGARCPDDPVPWDDQIKALLFAADRLMRDELLLLIHDDGMDFRSWDAIRPDLLARGNLVISWTGKRDFVKN